MLHYYNTCFVVRVSTPPESDFSPWLLPNTKVRTILHSISTKVGLKVELTDEVKVFSRPNILIPFMQYINCKLFWMSAA